MKAPGGSLIHNQPTSFLTRTAHGTYVWTLELGGFRQPETDADRWRYSDWPLSALTECRASRNILNEETLTSATNLILSHPLPHVTGGGEAAEIGEHRCRHLSDQTRPISGPILGPILRPLVQSEIR